MRRLRRHTLNPREHARAIVETVSAAWWNQYGTKALEVPLSVVGALMLRRFPEPGEPDVYSQIAALPPGAPLVHVLRWHWKEFVELRPDLINPVWPLISWLYPGFGDERRGRDAMAVLPDDTEVTAARAIIEAALRAGQLELTGTEARFEVDLLGLLLQELRARRDQQARGQFLTPVSVADMMARMLISSNGTPDAGESWCEPAMGTGGMLRAAAQAMREEGKDPTQVQWWGVDLDPLAVACAAVNAVSWNLGPQIFFGVGNALLPGWEERTVAQRAETIAIAQQAQSRAAVRKVLALLGPAEPAPDPDES
ncbi:N-6 DNA methylase [Micromonospora aurantiaca (nom. illeg.)]|uniref:N-6 DNA methylase n=1 Tax=Micromonospora aurantiaca (nom. illeg.) TaxID=47850 RepID=UPI0033D6304D